MAREIIDDVWLLEVAWPEPIGANAYLVDDGDITLVDAGLPLPRRSLSAELRDAGYASDEIDRVLLTHYDVDHVGGLARVELDVPVYLGAPDCRLVRRSWSPPWRHHKGAFHRIVRRLYSLSDADLRPVSDGEWIGGFQALHTPGHNPGHTVFIHPDADTALLGDLVWRTDEGFVPPPWLDSYDTEETTDSIDRIAAYQFESACPGHGQPYTAAGTDALRALAEDLVVGRS